MQEDFFELLFEFEGQDQPLEMTSVESVRHVSGNRAAHLLHFCLHCHLLQTTVASL